MSVELQQQPAVLRMTLEITRAATGLTETVELEGVLECPQPIQQPSETKLPT